MVSVGPYYEDLYEAFEAGQWGSRCYSSKQFTIHSLKGKICDNTLSNPAVGYEVGVTNALTRKVLMRIGRLEPHDSPGQAYVGTNHTTVTPRCESRQTPMLSQRQPDTQP